MTDRQGSENQSRSLDVPGVEMRDVGHSWAEFLGGMRFISGAKQVVFATELRVTQPTYSRWERGDPIHATGKCVIVGVFELSEAESTQINGGKPVPSISLDKMSPRSGDISERTIGALLMRLAKGPALSEPEIQFYKELTGLPTPPEQPPQTS